MAAAAARGGLAGVLVVVRKAGRRVYLHAPVMPLLPRAAAALSPAASVVARGPAETGGGTNGVTRVSRLAGGAPGGEGEVRLHDG